MTSAYSSDLFAKHRVSRELEDIVVVKNVCMYLNLTVIDFCGQNVVLQPTL